MRLSQTRKYKIYNYTAAKQLLMYSCSPRLEAMHTNVKQDTDMHANDWLTR